MIGDLDWPKNAFCRFVSDSWVSCYYYYTMCRPCLLSMEPYSICQYSRPAMCRASASLPCAYHNVCLIM